MKKLLFLLPVLLLSSCVGESKREKEIRYQKLGTELAKKALDEDIKKVIYDACEERGGTYSTSKIEKDRCLFYVPKKGKIQEVHINITVFFDAGKEEFESFDLYGRITNKDQDDEEMKYVRWNGEYSNPDTFTSLFDEINEDYVTRGVILEYDVIDAYLSQKMN